MQQRIERTPKAEYTKGYKYRLYSTIVINTYIFPYREINVNGVILTEDSKLIIPSGYCSDGPSGPTIDTASFMFGAFVHDGLYEILRCKEKPLHRSCNIVQPDYTRLGAMHKIYEIEQENIPVVNAASHDEIRKEADRFLIDIALEDGMVSWRAHYVYDSLRIAGRPASEDQKVIYSAPNIKYRTKIPHAPKE